MLFRSVFFAGEGGGDIIAVTPDRYVRFTVRTWRGGGQDQYRIRGEEVHVT
jgi:hypothetical protein